MHSNGGGLGQSALGPDIDNINPERRIALHLKADDRKLVSKFIIPNEFGDVP